MMRIGVEYVHDIGVKRGVISYRLTEIEKKDVGGAVRPPNSCAPLIQAAMAFLVL